MKLHRFTKFVNEALSDDLKNKISDQYKDIKEDLLNLIKESVNSDDESVIIEKLDSILKNPKDSTIEGLIQDSDVQDFYRKYRNDIDSILNENDFFENISEFQKRDNCISLYDLVVTGTMECVKILIGKLKEDLSVDVQSK